MPEIKHRNYFYDTIAAVHGERDFKSEELTGAFFAACVQKIDNMEFDKSWWSQMIKRRFDMARAQLAGCKEQADRGEPMPAISNPYVRI